ncbi:Prolyl oligopeptidase family protein [Mucilaginibacter pineti]|uniref:Prolyl oligopeptidase family protein n=1 Tax=Mucilaginibacter pineti TaxID=1391627 RepID=A0A1G7ETA8_9SPHI|nr:prolyl oligopeptidase family serine peptidase [Mucilaginibacter pineti]SDE66898.1 Prolyl oligopeptidase family protein [Mucilaginibacter pineti]
MVTRSFGIGLLLIGLLTLITTANAQKPVIDTSIIKHYSALEWNDMTENGRFFAYIVSNQPAGKTSLIISSTDQRWKKTLVFPEPPQVSFSRNSRFLLIQNADTLTLLKTGGGSNQQIKGISSFRLTFHKGVQWLVYTTKANRERLICRNLNTQQSVQLDEVKDFELSPYSDHLIAHVGKAEKTVCYQMSTESSRMISPGRNAGNYTWQKSGNAVIFTENTERNCKSLTRLMQFDCQNSRTSVLIPDLSKLSAIPFEGVRGLSEEGDLVLLKYEQKPTQVEEENTDHPQIFSTGDWDLTGKQPDPSVRNETYSFHLHQKKTVLVQRGREEIISYEFGPFILIKRDLPQSMAERVTYRKRDSRYYQVSTATGMQKELSFSGDIWPATSPGGRYLKGYRDDWHLVLYHLFNGKKIDLDSMINGRSGTVPVSGSVLRFLAWMPGDEGVLVGDQHDLWKINLEKNKATNLTRGFGKKKNTEFTVLESQIWDGILHCEANRLLLKSKNNLTGDEGFYAIDFSSGSVPEKLFSGRYHFADLSMILSRRIQNWKAGKKQSLYPIVRESAADAPNMFLTRDFKTFEAVSDIAPHKNYNWMSSELIHCRSEKEGDISAVLYKPEDFDSTKIYPVIIYYYEQMTQDLNNFHRPELCNGAIDIPWFVSRGYVVCTPDILNTRHTPGQTALNSVMAAYHRLKRMPGIDSSRIAISGHSFGGFETNFIVTHTGVFAAAYSGAGLDNLISHYGTVEDGIPRGQSDELAQVNLGTNPWANRSAYIENSPIFHIGEVSTPILLMHNKGDSRVPHAQSLEFFVGLRRLQKKAWLLDYKDEGHTIDRYQNQLDFTGKLTQFFDHYLKDKPAPGWMTAGESKLKPTP